ncbi:hypothetical protein OIU85_007489 [Salix viminalis]|uniref:Uncharacterized protein n=1 Tax=Salix viminalis TaxID=40686 RepID=A0A9Q0P992_SALVM|nr:hypothetical protein OIU85_007489 [Salix viminalis]
MATLISSCSDDHAATDVLEVENHVLSRDDQENLHTSHVGSEKKLSSHNIWSSRGKPKVVLQLQTIRSREKNRGAAIEWEKSDVEWENQDCIENRSISNTIFPGSEAAEEILTQARRITH